MCVSIPTKELDDLISELAGERVEVQSRQSITFMPNVDEEGFLLQPENWSEGVGQVLAQGEVPGGLTEDHWKVIDYLRQYYLTFKTVPPVRMLCRHVGFKFPYIRKLFPSGLAKGACKVAGIPGTTLKSVPLYP